MSKPVLRAGVIGTGWVAKSRHIPALRRCADVELVCLYDRHAERAEAAARELGVPGWHGELEAFLAERLDIVSVCTPPWTHQELACRAMNAGAHVFMEKPMAMDEAEARAIAEVAAAEGRILCVSHNLLSSRSVGKADRWLADASLIHALGLQISSSTRRLPTWYESLPGGLLMDESPHLLYLMEHFLDGLEVVDARLTRPPGGGSEPFTAEVRFQGRRAAGAVTMVFGAPMSEWHLTLVASGQVVDVDLFRDIAVRIGPDGPHLPGDILKTSANAIGQHAAGFISSGARFATRRLSWGHDALIRRFVDAVRQGGESPVPVDKAIAVVTATDTILDALGLRRESFRLGFWEIGGVRSRGDVGNAPGVKLRR